MPSFFLAPNKCIKTHQVLIFTIWLVQGPHDGGLFIFISFTLPTLVPLIWIPDGPSQDDAVLTTVLNTQNGTTGTGISSLRSSCVCSLLMTCITKILTLVKNGVHYNVWLLSKSLWLFSWTWALKCLRWRSLENDCLHKPNVEEWSHKMSKGRGWFSSLGCMYGWACAMVGLWAVNNP